MLTKFLNRAPNTCTLLAGALATLALPPYYLFPVLFVSFSFLLWQLNAAASWKQCFSRGYWFGFGFFAFGLAWIGNALLIDPKTTGWLYPLALGGAGAFFGLFVALPAALTFYFKNIYAKLPAFAALWVILEWIRSFILTGFPWNLLGTTLAFSNTAIQGAALIGSYGLSLIVILIAGAPVFYLIKRNRNAALIAAAVIFGLSACLCTYGTLRLHNLADNTASDIRLRLVQPSIPQAMKWSPTALEDNLMTYIKLSRAPGLEKIDLVIWGETASAFPLDMDDYYRHLTTLAVPDQGHLLTGLVRYEGDEDNRYLPLNSMFALNADGEIDAFYDKSHLVPFGEYIPLRRYLPDWIRPVTNTIANFKAGPGLKNITLNGIPAFGPLICYEVIFPAQVVDKSAKPEWLLNLTNDGWYGDSSGPYQHLVAARMRAVEEGITLVRVANTGISALINRLGLVEASLPLNYSGILDVSLPKKLSISTPYGKLSNIIPLILCFLNLTFAFFLNRHFT